MVLKVSAAKLHATSGHISLIKKLIEPSPVSSRGERILCFPPKKKKNGGRELIKHRGFTVYRSERETYFTCLFLGWKVVWKIKHLSREINYVLLNAASKPNVMNILPYFKIYLNQFNYLIFFKFQVRDQWFSAGRGKCCGKELQHFLNCFLGISSSFSLFWRWMLSASM